MKTLFFLIILLSFGTFHSKSVIIANYHNILMFFPKELGGNDDVRVIFDVRNVTDGSFKYLPIVVSVDYDTKQNIAYCYLESAITSYIMLLKWSGGRWCYQVLFEFPSTNFSKFMYHSIILWDNYIYWTTDRFIMSGRLPGYEKRLLIQPAWNQLYSMALDKQKGLLYVAAFDYTENALFSCSLKLFSCTKVIKTQFTLNYINFNLNTLYVSSIDQRSIFKLDSISGFSYLKQISKVNSNIANFLIIDESIAIFSDQQQIRVITNYNSSFPSIRKTDAHLIDPYALQYVFSFNKIFDFDGYPYPYQFSDYHNLLYKNNLYIFYFYVCGMSLIENDLAFLPQMDLNNQFLYLDTCSNIFYQDQILYWIPFIIGGSCLGLLIISAIVVIVWRFRSIFDLAKKSKNKMMSTVRNKDLNEHSAIATISNIDHKKVSYSPRLENMISGNWVRSIKPNEQKINHNMNTYYTSRLNKLNNIDILELPNRSLNSKAYQYPIVNENIENGDLTSLSSYESSSVSSKSSNNINSEIDTLKSPKNSRSGLLINETYINYIEKLKELKSKTNQAKDNPNIKIEVNGLPCSTFTNSELQKPSVSELLKEFSNKNHNLTSLKDSNKTILPNMTRKQELTSNIEVFDKFIQEPIHNSVNKLTERIQSLPNMTNSGTLKINKRNPVTVKTSLSRRESYLNIFKAADMSTNSSTDQIDESVRI